jgi:ribosomal protein S18
MSQIKKILITKTLICSKDTLLRLEKSYPQEFQILAQPEQRKLTKAVKIARFLALLPYTDSHR